MRSAHHAVIVIAIAAGLGLAPGAAEAQRPGAAAKVAARGASPGKPGVVRSAVRDTVSKLRGARQHKYMPMKAGETRTFVSTSSAGGQKVTGTQVERVTAVQRRGGTLRAQLETSWSSDIGPGTTTRHVAEVGRKGALMSVRENLSSPPAAHVKTSGVGLPRRLRVGKRWTNRMESTVQGYRMTHETTSRVTGRVKHRGPDGRTRTGFVIESVTRSTTVAPDGTRTNQTMRHQSTHVKGLGMVETRSTVDGTEGSMVRRMVDFTEGR